jgi:non-ribosomal peptide synthetase-like protein
MLGQAAMTNFYRFDTYTFLAFSVMDIAFNIAFFILLERALLGFKRLKPQLASIYDPYFWWHERYWKLNAFPILTMFAGTPFRGMLLRAMGMKVGSKLFDCSLGITERSLTEVGDYANLNEGCVLQAHSLEEGVFKSDYIRLGNRCSLGPGAFVHYGVSAGDDVVLDADSFLMKGEILDSHTEWCGNPAKILRSRVTQTEDCNQMLASATFEKNSTHYEQQGLSKS